jgi:hypothetical protein
LAGRIKLEREPISISFEGRRRLEPDIEKATLLFRREAAKQAKCLSEEQSLERKQLGKSGNPDNSICKICRDNTGKWMLEHVQGETFCLLPSKETRELTPGLVIRFGAASVVTIMRQGDFIDESSSQI